MFNNARRVLLFCYRAVKRFWSVLLRFGSPRFSIETFSEFVQVQAANEDERSHEPVDCSCQLQAA